MHKACQSGESRGFGGESREWANRGHRMPFKGA